MNRQTVFLSIGVIVALMLGACRSSRAQPTRTVQPTLTATRTPAPSETPTLPPSLDTATPVLPADTPAPAEADPASVTVEPEVATAAPGLIALTGSLPDIGEVLPTATPVPDADLLPVRELGVGEPGHYVNVTYGYDLRYPLEWYTGFGNRPMLVSFSNLDPGMTNRAGMRDSGCLIEVTASANTYNFTLATLRAQSPQTYEGAQEIELGGAPALLMVRQDTGQAFNSELLQVIAQERLFLISFEYAREREAECRPIWEGVRNSLRWFRPDIIPYKNQTYGYSISHPRRWHLFNPTDQGTFMSSVDPNDVNTAEELLRQGQVAHTHVFENQDLLPLEEFLVSKIGDLGLTDELDLGSIRGIRSIKEGPASSQAMIGYFQGPLGRIYAVEIFYPADRLWEFRPIANAVIYSFEF